MIKCNVSIQNWYWQDTAWGQRLYLKWRGSTHLTPQALWAAVNAKQKTVFYPLIRSWGVSQGWTPYLPIIHHWRGANKHPDFHPSLSKDWKMRFCTWDTCLLPWRTQRLEVCWLRGLDPFRFKIGHRVSGQRRDSRSVTQARQAELLPGLMAVPQRFHPWAMYSQSHTRKNHDFQNRSQVARENAKGSCTYSHTDEWAGHGRVA